MKKISLSLLIFAIVLTSCIQNSSKNQSSEVKKEEKIFIPFSSMTLTYMGKEQTQNQSGKILFEKERIIMQGGNSKEAFYIQKISEADNVIVFQTMNNKKEESTFYIEFNEQNVSKVKINILGMDGFFRISSGNADYSKLNTIYEENVSDCNCNLINRADGANINSCDPLPVSSDETMEVGLSLMSNNSIIYGAIALRFSSNIESIQSEVNIVLKNGYHIKGTIISQQKTIIGNSEVQLAIFNLSQKDIASIQNNDISVISFELDNNFLRSFQAQTNKDVLKKHYNCLTKYN